MSQQKASVDLFIDLLVEGWETILDTSLRGNITILRAMRQYVEAEKCPPTFDGNPSWWPDFILNFKMMAYLKTTFNGNTWIEPMQVSRGNAKKVESIGRNKETIYFMEPILKCLKQEFKSPNVVICLKLKSLFGQPQVIVADWVSLKLTIRS